MTCLSLNNNKSIKLSKDNQTEIYFIDLNITDIEHSFVICINTNGSMLLLIFVQLLVTAVIIISPYITSVMT